MAKTKKKERIAIYLDPDMADWLQKKADAIRVSGGHIIRRMILSEMQSSTKERLKHD
jgi:hypothetical protein